MALPPEHDPSARPDDEGDGRADGGRGPENQRPLRPGQTPHPHPHPHPPHHPPALRRTVVRPAGSVPDPVDAAYVATRLTTLTHELSTLLDGSLRVIGLARRSIGHGSGEPCHGHGSGEPCHGEPCHGEVCPSRLARQLETVQAAMCQMAELVRSTMIGMSENGAAGVRQTPTFGSSSSLSEAVRHAVDVMSPIAEEHCVQLDAQVAPELQAIAAGPLYAVVVNGVRNAIESIQRVGDRFVGGRVLVRCWMQGNGGSAAGESVMITIEDDGEGLPTVRGRDARLETDEPFRLGFTTKPGGSGIGLSLSRDVVEQLGGTIDLIARARDPHSGRAGAVLTICYPAPKLRMAG